MQSPILVQKSGFDWPKTCEVPTDDLSPGLYGVEIRQIGDNRKAFVVPFVLKSASACPIAVVLSTNTWDAYNEFGGISKYVHHHFNYFARKALQWASWASAKGVLATVSLPVRRPNSRVSEDLVGQTDPWQDFHSKWVRSEWCLISFLEEEGFDYALYTDEDLAFDESILECTGIVIPGHSEYWSEEMFYAYDRFVAKGGKVAISAGMPMTGRVAHEPGVKTYSPAEYDPEVVASRTGGYFTLLGCYTAAPYRATTTQSWIFDGTGMEDGEIFGRSSAYQAVPDFATRSEVPASGASGVWMNAVGRGSADFTVLARGMNEVGGAYMMFRDTPAGGWIFNAGSETFVAAIRQDQRIAKMMHNVLSDMRLAKAQRPSRLRSEPAWRARN